VEPPADRAGFIDPGRAPGPMSAPAEVSVADPAPPPSGSEADEPLAAPASLLARFVDELAVRVDLPAEWDRAADRLLDSLDTFAGNPLDLESPWVRLGCWVVTVVAIGVSIEMTRQGLRARQPDVEPATTPSLPVKR
jgi:hypothetical protein